MQDGAKENQGAGCAKRGSVCRACGDRVRVQGGWRREIRIIIRIDGSEGAEWGGIRVQHASHDRQLTFGTWQREHMTTRTGILARLCHDLQAFDHMPDSTVICKS